MSDNRKYYYLKLKESYFDDDAIVLLESMQDGNKKYSRSKPTIIRIPPTTLMPIRLTLLFFIILFAKTNSSAPTTIIKTDINGYMSFLLSNSDLLISNLLAANSISCCLRTASPQGIAALAAQGGVATLTERSDATFSVEQFSSADRE